MSRSNPRLAAYALLVATMTWSGAVQADEHHRHYHHHDNCLRFNKTTGTVAGAAAGGLIGHAVIGGPAGLLVGAAGGGLAGHHLARNGRKRCR